MEEVQANKIQRRKKNKDTGREIDPVEVSLFERIKAITDLEVIRVNDYLFFHESQGDDPVIVELSSDSHMEDDLVSSFGEGGSELTLGKDLCNRIIQRAFIETVKFITPYFEKSWMEGLFPGLDINEIESYDFSGSMIKVIILPNDTFEEFINGMSGDNCNTNNTLKGILGLSFKTDISFSTGDSLPIKVAKMDYNRRIVVLKELDSEGESSKQDIRTQVIRSLYRRVSHELLHQLKVANEFPTPIKEGVVEVYSQIIGRGNEFGVKGIGIGNPFETECVGIVFNKLLDLGISFDSICKCFISHSYDDYQYIRTVFEVNYGIESFNKLINWEFKYPFEALYFCKGLGSTVESLVNKMLHRASSLLSFTSSTIQTVTSWVTHKLQDKNITSIEQLRNRLLKPL